MADFLTVAALGLLALGIVIGIVYGIRREQRQQAALAALAQSNGWSFDPTIKESLPPEVNSLNIEIFTENSYEDRVRNLLRGKSSGRRFCAFRWEPFRSTPRPLADVIPKGVLLLESQSKLVGIPDFAMHLGHPLTDKMNSVTDSLRESWGDPSDYRRLELSPALADWRVSGFKSSQEWFDRQDAGALSQGLAELALSSLHVYGLSSGRIYVHGSELDVKQLELQLDHGNRLADLLEGI